MISNRPPTASAMPATTVLRVPQLESRSLHGGQLTSAPTPRCRLTATRPQRQMRTLGGVAAGGWPVRAARLPVDTVMVIRLGVPADFAVVADVYRRASLSNAGDRGNLLAHPKYLILGPDALAEGRTHVAEEDGSVVGFAAWQEAGGSVELEDLFVDRGWMRRGIATALVGVVADALRARGADWLEVTATRTRWGSTVPPGASIAASPRRSSASRLAWRWRSTDRRVRPGTGHSMRRARLIDMGMPSPLITPSD
jgi:GNAT superfamily N-acetyltransferase